MYVTSITALFSFRVKHQGLYFSYLSGIAHALESQFYEGVGRNMEKEVYAIGVSGTETSSNTIYALLAYKSSDLLIPTLLRKS